VVFLKQLNLKTKEIILASLSISLIAVGAFIKMPIFGVPFTLQLFFVLLTANILRPWPSFLTVSCYVLIGLIGVPVFSGGGGISYITYPTFGYVLGFLVSAPTVSYVLSKLNGTVKMNTLANIIGLIPVYFFGVIYYVFISNIYLDGAVEIKSILLFGFVIFLPLDIIYCFLSALISKRLKNIIKV